MKLSRREFSAALLPGIALAQQVASEVPAAIAPPNEAGPRFDLRFHHDENESELTLLDFAMPAERSLIACGIIGRASGRPISVVALSSDAGERWQYIKTKETGVSLSFVDESTGWMGADDGSVWHSIEGGRDWRKLSSVPHLRRVVFRDAKNGYALCGRKMVYVTEDGGRKWKKLDAASSPPGDPDHTAYEAADFLNDYGMIVGSSAPPRRDYSWIPDWMDPEAAQKRREWPQMTLMLQKSGDGPWTPSTAPIFGHITEVELARQFGLGLLQFRNTFVWPAELVYFDLRGGKVQSIFRRRNIQLTGLRIFSSGNVMLAAIDRSRSMDRSPVHGSVMVFESADLKEWRRVPVDYRAYGHRARLAGAGSQTWIATDTGMLLSLVPANAPRQPVAGAPELSK